MGRLVRLTETDTNLSKRPSNQALSPQERERENGDAVLQSVASVRLTHPPHTHRDGAEILEWQMWMHRAQKDWDEPNPLSREHSS